MGENMLHRRGFMTGVAAAAVLAASPIRAGAEAERSAIPGGAGSLSLLRRGARGAPVLLVHPYSPGAAAAFDVPGFSWMEHLAGAGRDAWAFDLAGFGASTRPAAMEGPPAAAAPVERASDGLRDLDAVVTHVLATRGDSSLDLVGWSFGSVLAAMYAVQRPERVKRLGLLGSMHGFDLPFMAELFEEAPGVLKHDFPAYRSVTPAFALAHWDMMRKPLPADTVGAETVKLVQDVLQASDPTRAPNVRQPTGPLVDLHSIWRNKPIYDAGAVKAPTLIVRGDRDLFADKGLVDKLTGAASRKEVVIENATHWVLYEKKRAELIAAVDAFLAGGG